MAFLNIPLKAIQGSMLSVAGLATMPWYSPNNFPVVPGDPAPVPLLKDYKWRITLNIDSQPQSSYLTRNPGFYTGQDIVVGLWIANTTTGQAWQIITVESKTASSVTVVVQDIYRYNTFRDTAGNGNGTPGLGTYVIFNIGETGIPEIDPLPPSGVSPAFGINIQSRFQYINLQYDYPLYQSGNTFNINDAVAVSTVSHAFVKSDSSNRIVVGRVTSISDTVPGWFTINPVQKIVDNLDYLPGFVGDTIYTDLLIPGGITATAGGTQLYIKLRDNTSSVSMSTVPNATTSPGNVFQLNGIDVTVGGTGTLANIVSTTNSMVAQTGVSAALTISQTIIQTLPVNISGTYGEPVLWASSSPATATINGVTVTFNIVSTDAGYEDYARPAQMAQSINSANIPNIVAISVSNGTSLQITNTGGGAITIVNVNNDVNGVKFAGTNSGSGLPLSTAASSAYQIVFTAVDARVINFLDVVGTTVDDVGLVSVENGVKACGLYVEEGLRTANSTVVANLSQLYALTALVGDQAYVIDSTDANGNNVGEWSMWLYDGSVWVETSNQDSATTDAKSLEYLLDHNSPASIDIGQISTGRRVTLITIEVTTPFNAASSLTLGYAVNSLVPSLPVAAGLMTANIIDLSVAGTYTTSTDVLFGTDTAQGDVTVTATFDNQGATVGSAQIIVSYV